MEPATKLELVKAILAQLNAQVMNQVLAQAFTGENSLVVIYSGPEKEGIATPTTEQLLQVIDEVKKSEIEAPAEEKASEPLMDPSSLVGAKVKKTKRGKPLSRKVSLHQELRTFLTGNYCLAS